MRRRCCMPWKPWKLERYRLRRRLAARRRAVTLIVVTEAASGLVRGRLVGPGMRELAVEESADRGVVVSALRRAAAWAAKAHDWDAEIVDAGEI